MEKTYITIRDNQGGSFGMYRRYTAREWGEQAYEWAYQDGWEEPDECLIENFKDEQELIDFIQEMWDLEIVEVNKDNQKLIDYLKEEIQYGENIRQMYNEDFYRHGEEMEWAKNILEELEVA